MPRFKGTWGDLGIVKATLNGMKIISKTRKNGYCILLSGQDYPLQPAKNIKAYLEKIFPTEFMTLYKIPHPGWETGGMDRLEKYKIIKSNQRKHFLQLPSIYDLDFYSLETLGKFNFLRKSGRFKEMSLIFKKRSFPSYLKPFGGSQWWALTMDTVKDILEFDEENPDYLKYHQYTLLPDEIFFHSILMKIKVTKKKHMQIKRSFTYVNWERPETPLPVTFQKEDFIELKTASSDYLFARKFDMHLDSNIFDQIDENLLY